jgi:hypothetical protein
MRTFLNILALSALLSGGHVSAQGISIIQGSDGTSGTVMDLGGGFQTYQFSSPHGGLQSGTILTLPSPHSSFNSPPAGLTPAPLLPFTPRSPITPREHMAPVVPLTPSTGTFNTFGGNSGRFGR